MKKPSLKNALLEIGTEELPARFITPALVELKSLTASILRENGLDHQSVTTWGTPRRLVVYLQGLSSKAKDQENLVIGPPPNIVQDDKGQWTPVAVGFAKAQGVSLRQLQIRDTPKGKRLTVVLERKGQDAGVLLKTIFPTLIQKLSFPKTMVWESTRFRFARPIRWILALHGSQVVRFRLAGVLSDRNSLGLMSLGAQKIRVPSADKYKSLLQGRCIVVDPEERRNRILKQLDTLAKKLKAAPLIEAEHLDEVVQLTEHPVAILGQFHESYLALPREVLTSVLRKHQKFFPIESTKGKLTNSFIGVRNGLSDQQDMVRDGYERVLAARLSDAHFFFDHDSKTRLETLVPKLAGVGFHDKLGSVLDKTNRVVALVGKLQRWLQLTDEQLEGAKRAAWLAKADLLTQMVGEFPELQGAAGRFYAEQQEKKEVATAIEEHHWPLSAEGKLPTTLEGAVVSIADKLDTLAADFSIGLIPTGSNDPYALRRASIGILRLLLEWKWDVSVENLIDLAFEGLGTSQGRNELLDFLDQRIHGWFENQGFRPDEVDAVLSNNDQNLLEIQEKLKELRAIRGKPEFESISVAIKRANNILKQAREKGLQIDKNGPVDEITANDPSEAALKAALINVRPRLFSALEHGRFREAFLELSPLRKPVDDFFNGVMVMVDDENVRASRLRLLAHVKTLFDSVADFSKLQTAAPK